ncbi:MAG: pyridoxamine 5'-phosphate oxidase family protein [Bacteroidota bacterium]
MLTADILHYIDRSVLCWLATTDHEGQPNVSPKEVFTHFGESHLLIANIASPNTVRNLKSNHKVCVSFVDVLVQKGYQLKGTAELVYKKEERFDQLAAPLLAITKGLYPFASLTFVKIEHSKPIIAPSYRLYPEQSVEEKIASAKKAYGLD